MACTERRKRSRMLGNYLAIDIGGSKLLVGAVDPSGKILTSEKMLLHGPTQDSVLESVFSLCDPIVSSYGISCIGVSIPGLADSRNGIWLEAVFSKVSNFPIGAMLNDRYSLPVYVDNDANNCACGEKLFGCAKEYEDFIWLTVSNGCGSGVFLGGKLFAGSHGNAGELGHICVTSRSYRCPCGNNGCLESVAAGPGLVLRYKQRTGAAAAISAKEIADLAKKGDRDALFVYEKTGTYIGRAIAAAVNVLNVPLVVVGGGIGMDFPLYEEALNKAARDHIYRTANTDLRIVKTALGYYASLVGAAANAILREQR